MRGRRASALALLGLSLCACRSGRASIDQVRCAPDVEPLPTAIQRGMSLAHNYQDRGARGYGSKTSDETLKELAGLGVESVSLTPFGFMQSLHDPVVHFIGDYPGGESDERMGAVLRQAEARGLSVMLKPHLWIARGQWRGNIEFAEASDWSRWFDSYERWILHYADMAQRYEVDTLVVGVELRSSQRAHAQRWRELVAKVRERFDGKLTYSANWDDASELPWWEVLDYIGVQFYPPLATGPDPARAVVGASLSTHLDALERLSKRFDKPVLITEVGYRSADDALQRPHEWPERVHTVRPNPVRQALGYRAFIESIRPRPWVRGVYWWKWFTDPTTNEEGQAGFSPRDKPAERVLRAAYDGSCD